MSTHYIDLVNGNDANSGADWANAWLTITTGAGAGDIAPGDTIRVSKSPDPVSIGTCQWNDLSKVVTRTGSPPAGSETLLVDDCESGWTAANASTVTHPTSAMKSGSANLQITHDAYATSTLYAYKALAGATDFSGYEAITLWVRTDAAIADTARWSICLCSDAAGATPVDTFAAPALPVTNRWTCVRLTRAGGGALGASIQSIAVYTGASAPTNGQDLFLDNINACNDFSLCSLVTKNSAATGGTEACYGLQSINGNVLLLDNDTETIASAGRGYCGTTEEVATYRREAIRTTLVAGLTTPINAINASGTDGSSIVFEGGWTVGGSRDGETYFDGSSGAGLGISFPASTRFVTIERFSCFRFTYGLNMTTADRNTINCGDFGNCAGGGLSVSPGGNAVTVRSCNNNASNQGMNAGTNNTVTAGQLNNNTGNGVIGTSCKVTADAVNNNGAYGLNLAGTFGNVAYVGEMRNNATAQASTTTGRNILHNTTMTGTEVAGFTNYANSRLYSHNHNLSGYDKQFTDGGTLYQEATDFDAPATGKMWSLLTSATTRTSSYPLKLRLPGIAVVANKLVTISARMRKAHATNVVGKLVLPGGQIAGVVADVVATLASATTEEELTITFTPTAAGVVVPEVWAEYVAGHAAVCIDRFTSITQAA